ncbi:MAG: YdeI/OmpD-associated family protein [Candidatus Eisenbacteria bacterium]|nr:YdeI/OmpD-associated family protein [Candidatus Eisenbacteria bacterium]
MPGTATIKSGRAATIAFWKYSLLVGEKGTPERAKAEEAMGMFGCLKSKADLPSDRMLLAHLKKAMKLNEEGIRAPRSKTKRPRPVITMPPALTAALKRNKKAKAAFDAFSPSHQREYMEWIGEAKAEATREKRLLTALEWVEDGKPRNWKYMKK